MKLKSLFVAAALGASALIMSAAPARAADVDYRASVTSVAATVTHTFTNDADATASAFLVDSVMPQATTSTSTTFTAFHVVGTVTNLAIGKTGTASRVITTTTFPPFFIGDKLVMTSSDTNTFTIKINARRR